MKTIDMNEAVRLVKEGTEITHKERMKLRDERLRELVSYVRENSPYLKKLYSDLPENFSLSDLPVTEKQDVINNYEDWVTDRDIRLKDVEVYCERDSTSASLYLDKYTVLHTSGTTGSPLYMVRDDHRNKLHGQMVAQRLLKGIDPGIMDHTKHKVASVIYAVHGSSSYEGFLRQQASVPGMEDRMLAINVLEDPDVIVEKLNAFQPEVLSGYASALTLLALEKQKRRLNINVKFIANSAETLTRENHLLIEEAFGCPVKNNYCMTEGGEVAMTQDGPGMLLNEDFVIVEPVDENRKPVTDPGEWSGGILITDLTNYVQPVIRYYVNDSVKIEQIPDDQVRLPNLLIHGRVCALFELCGKMYSISGIDSMVELYKGVVDYQFVQTADDVLQIRALTSDDVDRENTLQKIAGEIQRYFNENGASDAVVTYSMELPVKKQRGGKAPRYMDIRA